jgi:hypothetical protein
MTTFEQAGADNFSEKSVRAGNENITHDLPSRLTPHCFPVCVASVQMIPLWLRSMTETICGMIVLPENCIAILAFLGSRC